MSLFRLFGYTAPNRKDDLRKTESLPQLSWGVAMAQND